MAAKIPAAGISTYNAATSDADLGSGIHIKTADSGASVDTNGDELVIEGSGNAGVNILTGTSANGRIAFGDSGDANIGNIVYDHSANKLKFTAAADENFMYDGTRVGMGATGASADLGTGLHIRTADSGASVDSNIDELVIEGSGHSGLSILSGTSSESAIAFGDSGDNNIGRVVYDHNSNEMFFMTSATEALRLGANIDLSTGGESSPDVSEGGLCLDQNAADNPILSLKSSDIGIHSNSGFESDTYFHIGKLSGTTGGTIVRSFSEAGAADVFEFRALMGQAGNDTAKSTSANAPFMFKAADIHSTEGIRAMADGGTNSNLFIISDHTTRRFIFDSEGDLHSDSSNTTFDSYEDAHLVRAFDLSHGRGVIDSKFDEFVKYKHEDLANIGLVGREDDGTPNHFINITGFQRLHNGAIWQQYEKTERLANAMYELAKAAVGEDKANEILEQNDITLLN